MNLHQLRILLLRNKAIISNFSYLSLLQFINLLLPLIAYPYLIETLGSEVFGKVIFAQAIIGYFVILVNFGFNITGVSAISKCRGSRLKMSIIFSSIFFIKILLFLITTIVIISSTYLMGLSKDNSLLVCLTLWMCLYDIVIPIWYFQGIEQMKYITLLTLVMKLFFLGLILIFIKDATDYLKVPIINGCGTLVTGLLAGFIIVCKHKITIMIPRARWMLNELKSALPIFISNISIQLYVATNKVVLGVFLGMKEVALYDLIEKILSVLRIPQIIFTQTVFPKISREKNIGFIKKTFKLSFLVNILVFVVAFIIADFLIKVLGGESLESGVSILRILLVTIPVTALSNVLGVQTLIPFGFSKEFSRGIIISCIFYFILLAIIWLFSEFTIFNVSYSIVATEIFVALILFHFCRKFKLW